jgi:hypothetical protein
MKLFHRPLLLLALSLLIGHPLVHAVPCNNPANAYTENGDGTVSDKRTGLMWLKCAEGTSWGGGTCTGSASKLGWSAALTRASSSSAAGHSDWRLPNVKELRSLVEECSGYPAINSTIFPAATYGSFWSGSPDTYYSGNAWSVDFGYGGAVPTYRYNANYVRLVRAGQSPAEFDSLPKNGQTISFSAAASVTVGGTAVVGATASSGLPVTLASTAPGICTLSGNLLSGVAVGTCTLTADQSGDSSYYAAPQVKQNIAVALQPTYTLNVYSSGASSVAIAATPSMYAGTTPYGTTGIPGGTSIALTAPETLGNSVFTAWSGCTGASGVVCSLIVNAATVVTASYQTLLSQSIVFGAAPIGLKVGDTGFVSATASSGLAVAFTSTTPGICTLTGNTVRAVGAGSCVVAANQAGDGTYSAAPQVEQSFGIAAPAGASAPGSPSISTITPGRGSSTLQLVAPKENGGSPIVSYAATCTASNQPDRTASGADLTLTVRGLKGGVLYACTATASNAYYSSVGSAAKSVTPDQGGSNMTPILLLLLD